MGSILLDPRCVPCVLASELLPLVGGHMESKVESLTPVLSAGPVPNGA